MMGYIRLLFMDNAQKADFVSASEGKLRRTDLNLQLSRAELYIEKKRTLRALRRSDARVLELKDTVARLMEEAKSKDARIREFECAFTLQHELPNGDSHAGSQHSDTH
jgi:hypothetical protein